MKIPVSRRSFLKTSALATGAALSAPLWQSQARGAIAPATPLPDRRMIAPGKFSPTWESLTQNFKCPDWYRDAKFGIWAHWTAQCVPEQGDWYARNMYIQGNRQYEYHVKNYGHPSKFGFMEINNLWKLDGWEPERLMALYKRAGAKIFFGLANHHDNFDAYDSKYHAWNSVNVGPKRDIVGTWARVARANGLRFGVSNHSAHAWRWMQTAYAYDGEGPMAGVRYDAATLTKADGAGKWWDGLDPQELYTGATLKMPDGIKDQQAVVDWLRANTFPDDKIPAPAAFADSWFFRCQDLVDKYNPDILYFDNADLPLGQTGVDLVTHYYNRNMERHDGRLEGIVTGKQMKPEHISAVVEDIERGVANGIRAEPWQTDTCIGTWHYSRPFAEANRYKTVDQVVDMLLDIVSKNGNLMLSIPIRGNGTIDEKEEAFLNGLATWMAPNGEGIFSSRPWKIYGEGPSTIAGAEEAGQFGGGRDVRTKPFTPADIRFTTKGGALFAYLLAVPTEPRAVIVSLGTNSPQITGRKVTDVSLLGYAGKLTWSQTEQGLVVTLPEKLPTEHAIGLRVSGVA